MINLGILKQFAASTGECGANTTTLDSSCLPHASANAHTIDKILSIVFAVTASMAVMIIVIAGLRYILAHGDPSATATARNAILYAVIGLLVSMAAFSIVTFVVGGIG